MEANPCSKVPKSVDTLFKREQAVQVLDMNVLLRCPCAFGNIETGNLSLLFCNVLIMLRRLSQLMTYLYVSV